jgi:poly-gamma-glutamate synthesis protein (capsule biosynthesis protein)
MALRISALVLGAAGVLLAACGGSSGAESPSATTAGAGASPASPTATPTPTPTPTPTYRLTLAAVGDVMLARDVGDAIVREGPGVVFAGVREVLTAADIAVVNLECAISDLGEPLAKEYTFRAPVAAVGALMDAGVDVAGQGNNHALDYGREALMDTRARVTGAGIGVTGSGADSEEAHEPVILNRNGLRVAFLAYADLRTGLGPGDWSAADGQPGVAVLDVERMAADIAAAKATADIVAVLIHFGVEGSFEANGDQRYAARSAIDAGATLVLGHHPHVLQEVEEYGGGLIAYSLGNFVFDGFEGYSGGTDSAILRVTLDRTGVAGWEMLPVAIGYRGFPILD